jgi:hypothetical protein
MITLHHPPLSADDHHGSSPAMAALLDGAFQASGRTADLVLSGHVHNYQRFIRTIGGKHIPYIVAGAGGYHNLHQMAAGAAPGLTVADSTVLQQFCDDKWGFLRLWVGNNEIGGRYTAVGADGTTSTADSFTLSNGRVSN